MIKPVQSKKIKPGKAVAFTNCGHGYTTPVKPINPPKSPPPRSGQTGPRPGW
jgi:hypothetical protein